MVPYPKPQLAMGSPTSVSAWTLVFAEQAREPAELPLKSLLVGFGCGKQDIRT